MDIKKKKLGLRFIAVILLGISISLLLSRNLSYEFFGEVLVLFTIIFLLVTKVLRRDYGK